MTVRAITVAEVAEIADPYLKAIVRSHTSLQQKITALNDALQAQVKVNLHLADSLTKAEKRLFRLQRRLEALEKAIEDSELLDT